MGRKAKTWIEYPSDFIQICQKLNAGEPACQLGPFTHNIAVNRRHLFYKFLDTYRRAIFRNPEAAQEASHIMGTFTYDKAHNITVQIKPFNPGEYYLDFRMYSFNLIVAGKPQLVTTDYSQASPSPVRRAENNEAPADPMQALSDEIAAANQLPDTEEELETRTHAEHQPPAARYAMLKSITDSKRERLRLMKKTNEG